VPGTFFVSPVKRCLAPFLTKYGGFAAIDLGADINADDGKNDQRDID